MKLLTVLLIATAAANVANVAYANTTSTVSEQPTEISQSSEVLKQTSLPANAVIRLSEPVDADSISETFGAKLDQSLTKVSLTQLLSESEKYLGKPIQIETRIAKVCQKKGCFFIAQEKEHVIRVSFKDYGFFIPTDAGGKTVTLAAQLIKKEMSPEQAAHFKQDLNTQSDIINAGVVYELVADSIKIPRAS